MSFVAPLASTHPRVTAEERARVRAIALPVARAARVLLKQRRTTLPKPELEALGMLTVWRRLDAYDPSLGTFDRWAFYRAFQAMLDACREHRKEADREAALRRGAVGYVTHEDSPPEIDFHNDTPETDLGRAGRRMNRLGVSAWIQPVVERCQEPAPAERTLAAMEALGAVHEEIARLSDEQRTYLQLRFWDEAEVADVSAKMAVPERTLRRRWAETRDLLAARLRARGIFGIPEGFGEVADARGWSGGSKR